MGDVCCWMCDEPEEFVNLRTSLYRNSLCVRSQFKCSCVCFVCITMNGGQTSSTKRGQPTIVVDKDGLEQKRLARQRHRACLKKKGCCVWRSSCVCRSHNAAPTVYAGGEDRVHNDTSQVISTVRKYFGVAEPEQNHKCKVYCIIVSAGYLYNGRFCWQKKG